MYLFSVNSSDEVIEEEENESEVDMLLPIEEEENESEVEMLLPVSPKRQKTSETQITSRVTSVLPETANKDTEDYEDPIMTSSKPIWFCEKMCGFGLCHKCYIAAQKKEELEIMKQNGERSSMR